MSGSLAPAGRSRRVKKWPSRCRQGVVCRRRDSLRDVRENWQRFVQPCDLENMADVVGGRGETKPASKLGGVPKILEQHGNACRIDERYAAEIHDQCRATVVYLGREQGSQSWSIVKVDLVFEMKDCNVALSGFV
jgi:hypothetical protein